MAFFLKKLYRLEFNYPIYDKELIAIIESFKEQRPYFNGTKHQIKIYIDYKNLIYFTTSKDLNQQQIQQSEFLNEFNFQIIYRKGSKNGRANTLNWRPDHFERREKQNIQLILKKEQDRSFIQTKCEFNVVLLLKQNTRWLAILQDQKNDQKFKELKEVINNLFLDKLLDF